MIKMSDKDLCCGCGACANACPKKCISMVSDDKGFLHPVIDESKCIKCNKCEKVCQIYNHHNVLQVMDTPIVYACHSLSENQRTESSSGGISVVLADYVIENGGVVFGVVYDDNMKAIHCKIDNKNDICKLQKSKYVQSDIGDVYSEVHKLLIEGVMVLFTGTPCQIGGLYQYLQKDYENLITMDIICFGVPSPKIFKDYVEWFERKEKQKILNIDYRNKTKGWNSSSTQIICESGKEYLMDTNKNEYYNIFRSHIAIRSSCNHCLYTNMQRYADISAGDYWGIENFDNEYDTFKGVSKVLINTEKGKKVWDCIKDKMCSKEMSVESAIRPNLVAPSKVHEKREEFFETYNRAGFEKTYNKYIKEKVDYKKKIKKKIKNKIKRMLGK